MIIDKVQYYANDFLRRIVKTTTYGIYMDTLEKNRFLEFNLFYIAFKNYFYIIIIIIIRLVRCNKRE